MSTENRQILINVQWLLMQIKIKLSDNEVKSSLKTPSDRIK